MELDVLDEGFLVAFRERYRAAADMKRTQRGLKPWDWSLPFGPPVDLDGAPPGLDAVRFQLERDGATAKAPPCSACKDGRGRYSVWDGNPEHAPEERDCPHVRIEQGAKVFSAARLPAIGGRVGLSFDGFVWKRLRAHEATRGQVMRWCEHLNAPPSVQKLLVLWGSVGAGKTHLAAAIVHWAAFMAERPVSCSWVRWRDYLDFCWTRSERRDQVRSAGLLVVDELSHSGAAWEATELEELLDRRLGWGGATVFTTNMDATPDGAERSADAPPPLASFGARAYSRLIGCGTMAPVFARDYRLRSKTP